MKIIKRLLTNLFLFLSTLLIIPTVYADSGLESTYKDSSFVGVLIEVFMNLGSVLLKLIVSQPGDEDYYTNHIIISIFCLIIIYIFTNIYLFKLDKRKKNAKQVIILLLISLLPVILFSLLFLLTSLQLVLYILITIIYIITLIIIINIIIKNKIGKQLLEVNNIDKKFNEEEFNKKAFDIYKKVQISWSLFKLKDVKDIISNNLYNDYDKKLIDLKNKNQKNIMDNIEYKSNNIVYININNNIEEIICEMNVVCTDYIIEGTDKVVKGEKNKKYNYVYRLYFTNNIKTNKLVLEDKKLLKTKVEKVN